MSDERIYLALIMLSNLHSRVRHGGEDVEALFSKDISEEKAIEVIRYTMDIMESEELRKIQEKRV